MPTPDSLTAAQVLHVMGGTVETPIGTFRVLSIRTEPERGLPSTSDRRVKKTAAEAAYARSKGMFRRLMVLPDLKKGKGIKAPDREIRVWADEAIRRGMNQARGVRFILSSLNRSNDQATWLWAAQFGEPKNLANLRRALARLGYRPWPTGTNAPR